MAEKSPSKAFKALQILIPLASLAVAITAILLTVASRRKELTCTETASTRLVSENLGGIHPDIRVEFHGQPIVSLTKLSFTVRNTGSSAVKEQDVVDPLKLRFATSTRLMNAVVERTSPADLKFLVHTTPESSEVLMNFPLLNAGDEATFSVYVFNSDSQQPKFEGRITDVSQLIYSEMGAPPSNQFGWPLQNHATRSVLRWILLLLYGILTGLFVGFWVSAIVSYIRYIPWKHRWKEKYDEVFNELRKKERERIVTEPQPGETTAPGPDVVPEMYFPGMAIQEAGVIHINMMPRLAGELKKLGIPPNPEPMVDSLPGMAGLSVFLLSLSAIFATTGFIIYKALVT